MFQPIETQNLSRTAAVVRELQTLQPNCHVLLTLLATKGHVGVVAVLEELAQASATRPDGADLLDARRDLRAANQGALSVACPFAYCRAAAGEPCRAGLTLSRSTTQPHLVRRRAAEQAAAAVAS